MSLDIETWYIAPSFIAKGFHLVNAAGSHINGSPAWFPSENMAIAWASARGVSTKRWE